MEMSLISKAHIAEDTIELVYKKPHGFRFTAGQNIDITLGTMVKPLSIAASPNEPVIRIAMRMTGSKFKKLLQKAKTVRFDGPFGNFILPPSTRKKIIMLAGGIGITPIYSMIKYAYEKKLKYKINLFYKNSSIARAAFLEELKKWNV